MNWRSIDLNLLVVFDAVMRERSVTRAGRLIGLSQPAMSHALNRLRHMLGDELFVRTPDGMTPTPRAEAIAEPLRNALSEMQLALEPLTFDPQESDRRFTISLNNFAAVVIGPPLVTAACGEAPGIQLDMRPSGTLDVADCLDRGEFDLAIGSEELPGERFLSQLLLEDPFVLVMRRGHPASHGPLSAETLASLRYLEISSSGEDIGFLDRWLAARGLARQVGVRAPYLSGRVILAESRLRRRFQPPGRRGVRAQLSPGDTRTGLRLADGADPDALPPAPGGPSGPPLVARPCGLRGADPRRRRLGAVQRTVAWIEP